MKIAIIVHGRFHAFELSKALLRRGHDVTVLTNYPRWAAARFGVPRERVLGFSFEGALSRGAMAMHNRFHTPFPDAALHRLFGTWAAWQASRGGWDWIYSFSQVSEEVLEKMKPTGTQCFLARGSAHIRVQARLLDEESVRTSTPLEIPNSWTIAREEREYGLATKIVVQSEFAYRSFLAQGFTNDRLVKVPMGVNVSQFRAAKEIIEARVRRILSGEPLRLLFVGNLSMQKGVWDLLRIAEALPPDRFRLRVIGSAGANTRRWLLMLSRRADMIPRQPHNELPRWYGEADVFLFPTIQDGFAAVLAEAQASGLPVLTTTNCAGPDLLSDGVNGWILPIRSPQAFVERLMWCDGHRDELAAAVRRLYYEFQPRSYDDAASDLEQAAAASSASALAEK